MANKKITELPLITSVTTGDDIPIVQTGATSRVHSGAAGGLDADLVDGIHGAAMWYSSSGTGGSDGNAGQPPAPKSRVATDSDIGQYRAYTSASGAGVTLPAGGTWSYDCTQRDVATGVFNTHVAGVAAGGTTIAGSDIAGYSWSGTIKRES